MSEHEGLSIFDSGTAAGTFTVVLRGYDRNEVNSYISKFEAVRRESDAELEKLRAQVQDLDGRASSAEARLQEVGEPTYAGLGGRVSELLRLAETQAAQIRSSADDYAQKVVADGGETAAASRADADAYGSRVRQGADAAAQAQALALQTTFATAAAEHAARVRDQQQALADDMDRQRAALEAMLAAHRQTIEAAQEAHRALVDRETAALAAKLAKDRESAAAAIAVQYQTAEVKIAALTKAAQDRADAADAAAAAAHERAEDAVLVTETNTKVALEHARRAADEITAAAEAEADRLKAEAVAASKAETEKLERRIQALRTERDAMVAHLAGLKKIIGDIGD
jgi:hypothetical protein